MLFSSHFLVCKTVFLLMMHTAGITGLKLSTLRENWSSRYQFTNDAGIPAPTGFYWDFEYVVNLEFVSVSS